MLDATRQVASIATAIGHTLAQDAALMLLDEPATALDPKHQAELIALIRSLVDTGKTVVVVAHDLNLAAAIAGRVIALLIILLLILVL